MLLTALSMLYHLFRAAVTGRVMSLDLTKFTTYLRTKNQQLKRREIDGSLAGANNARPHTSTMLYTVETPSPVEPSRVKYYRKHFGSRFRATFLILYKSDGMANGQYTASITYALARNARRLFEIERSVHRCLVWKNSLKYLKITSKLFYDFRISIGK